MVLYIYICIFISETSPFQFVQLMCQFLFFSSSSLAQLSAFDICAEKALDVDLPVEKILRNFFTLFMALIRCLPQALFYVIRRKDFGQFVVSLYEMIVSSFQCCHRFHFVCYISLQLFQFRFFGCISFYKKRYKLIKSERQYAK